MTAATATPERLREALLGVRRWVQECPYIAKHPGRPSPRQALALLLQNERELCFGGAVGGGKSDFLLMDALRYVDVDGYAALIVRRTYAQLEKAGALMDRAQHWFAPTDAIKRNGGKKWVFPHGGHYQGRTGEAVIEFGYLQHPGDELSYQSAEFQFFGMDEGTHWPTDGPYRYVGFSRVRRPKGASSALARVPLRTRLATNPGGPGHEWVRERFNLPYGRAGRPFIPSKIHDNPGLDVKTYIEGLLELHPTTRKQLLDGDWDARDPGDYWRREWIKFIEKAPPHSVANYIRFWDLAATEKSQDAILQSPTLKKTIKACFTSGTLQARDVHGEHYVCDQVRGQWAAGKRNAIIEQTAKMDGRRVVIGIEEEPGSGGKWQAEYLADKLKRKGYRAWVFKPDGSTGGKTKRADPVAAHASPVYEADGSIVRDGQFSVVVGDLDAPAPWVAGFMSRMESFPENELVLDDMDSVSGGYTYLVENPPRRRGRDHEREQRQRQRRRSPLDDAHVERPW